MKRIYRTYGINFKDREYYIRKTAEFFGMLGSASLIAGLLCFMVFFA